jgi:hypothetical protein
MTVTEFRVLVLTAIILTCGAFVSPAAAQQSSSVAALAEDVGGLSDKFVGLARVMTGKYNWRPGQGVRSVAEVFNLIVDENRMLNAILTGAEPPRMGATPPIADPTAMQEALRTSYAAVRQTLARMSAADANAKISMFGRETSKLDAATGLLFDQHEHLGQSIAYARTNGVVPPWSR